MGGNLTCGDRKSGTVVHSAVETALASEFKNPYNTSRPALQTTTITACDKDTEGYTSVNDDGSNVTIVTCPANGDALVTNTVQIE
jgi:type IV pilus assembly protein PilA